ncbi:hypothetical protein [uncultured Roseobacter sp.]|uniref:anti-sigma factor family protein n=1 Tax=uncultured Roseobacter sp. TaxID=114847 RepID=UPI00260C8A03|nr:hypothetical protein [uncultured Roseobacter sp.]
MTEGTWISDEDLTAYLDGEAEEALCRKIDKTLAEDTDLQARLSALTLDVDALRAGVLAAVPLPPPMPTLPAANRSRAPLGMFSAGLAAGLAIGAFTFATFFTKPAPRDGWAGFVASYQKLYTAETLNAIDQPAAETQAQLLRVSEAIGLDLGNLPAVDGLTLKRAQILGFKGKPLVQIAYQRTDGTPVALCIILSPSQDPMPLTESENKGLQTVRWNRDNHGFLLIGDMDPMPLKQAAEVFAAAL